MILYIYIIYRIAQTSTDGLSSICPLVHLRPRFQNFNGPSSWSVHKVDGPCSSAVQFRPSIKNNHSPSSKSVHEMDGPTSYFGHMDRRTDGRSAEGRLRPRGPGIAFSAKKGKNFSFQIIKIFEPTIVGSTMPTKNGRSKTNFWVDYSRLNTKTPVKLSRRIWTKIVGR